MKKNTVFIILIFPIILLVLSISISACSGMSEISREILEGRYISDYDGVETEYVYKFNILEGEFVLVPEIKTVHRDAAYEVLYRITYMDGSTEERWESVSEDVFNSLSGFGSVTYGER